MQLGCQINSTTFPFLCLFYIALCDPVNFKLLAKSSNILYCFRGIILQTIPVHPTQANLRENFYRITCFIDNPTIAYFPLFPPFPKYIPLKIPSTNESRLFPGSRHSGVKKESFFLFFHFHYSLLYLIVLLFFHPRLFQLPTCVPYG